ncbi:MAG: hypothetical protein H6737_08260 [Alphaproteobacteria bacterium]|nr:hypothetical protein [Alphaproteobacteria bacterium]
MTRALVLLALVGCKRAEPEKLLDTGWFEDTDGWSEEGCANRIEATVPAGGEDDWYWRTMPRIFTANREIEAYDAYVLDADGYRLGSGLVWDDESLRFDVVLDAPLAANTDHVLRVVDCNGTREVPFTTSVFGGALVGGAEMLEGRAYSLDIGGATWLEPGGVAPLLTLFFNAPVLIGVPLSQAGTLHLNLALGVEDDEGNLRQDSVEDAVPFPLVAFDQQPYFEAEAPTVDLDFSGVRIPVYEFAFSGTFSPTGDRIGGGTVEGIGDTRFAGPLLGSSDEDTVCTTAAGLGVQCMACPTDGEPYCLPVSVRDIEGVYVPGLTIRSL